MGVSYSKAESEQSANTYMAQQFSGTCNVTCQNALNNVVVDIIGSTIGGSIKLDQSCSTNASCLIDSTSNATSDVMFKATNSSNASSAWSIWSGNPFSFEMAESLSRQDIKQTINQTSSEACNISSYNQMDNITIFVANSTIGGDISISQNASTQGQCKLKNSMSAAAYASGTAQNVAKSGKDKKGDKASLFTYIVIGIVVVVIVGIVAKVITGQSEKSKKIKQMKAVIEARAEVGCPGGVKPIMDPKSGKPMIDPRTQGPICPAPKIIPVKNNSKTKPL